MYNLNYLMENDDESFRLDSKTDVETIVRHAKWAGLEPGMRVADIGCGPGTATYVLHNLAQPDGKTIGIDISEQRISYAQNKYSNNGVKFLRKNIHDNLDDLGKFDFIWIRFVLEYYRKNSFEIVKKLTNILNPGGILCLIDLDNNCLNHYGIPERLEKTINALMKQLEDQQDFDPYIGRKLYSFLYQLNLKNINIAMEPHHLIFGELNEIEAYDWTKKIEVAAKNSGFNFKEYYSDGFEEFYRECKTNFAAPGTFSYTPVIVCRGEKE